MTSGDWRPGRLREAREALHEHGRKVTQARFGELIGCSERSVERYESWQVPKARLLPRIVEVTGRPVEWFFEAVGAELDPGSDLEHALTVLLRSTIDQRTAELAARVEELERQQRAEGWKPRSQDRAALTRRTP